MYTRNTRPNRPGSARPLRLPWGLFFLFVILLSLVACDQADSAALPTALPTLPTEPTAAVTVLAETAEAPPTSAIPDYSAPIVPTLDVSTPLLPTATPTGQPTVAPTALLQPTAVPQPTAAPRPTAVAVVDEGEVELEDFQFVPRVLTVRVGTEVKFSNKDREIHTVSSDTGLFDSGSLSRGEEFYYTFTQAGEYPYYCAPHGGPGGRGMAGTIIVVP